MIQLRTIDGTLNEYPYGEVVDTFVDALNFAKFVEGRLKDGADLGDALAIFPELPKLLEIYNDRKVFAMQFLDLTAEEAAAAVKEIAEKVNIDESSVMEKGVRSLGLAARAYRLYVNTRAEVEGIVADAKLIFA